MHVSKNIRSSPSKISSSSFMSSSSEQILRTFTNISVTVRGQRSKRKYLNTSIFNNNTKRAVILISGALISLLKYFYCSAICNFFFLSFWHPVDAVKMKFCSITSCFKHFKTMLCYSYTPRILRMKCKECVSHINVCCFKHKS